MADGVLDVTIEAVPRPLPCAERAACLLRRPGARSARLGDRGGIGLPASGNANLGGTFLTSMVAATCRRGARPRPTSSVSMTDEVVFGANMTSLNFALSHAPPRVTGAPATRWSSTRLDHDANVAPWLELAHDRASSYALRARRRVPARPRSPALAALRPDEGGRVPLGIERGRDGDPGARGGRPRPRGRRSRVGRRGAVRTARGHRGLRRRRRRAALLAVQVLRPPPRARVRPARAARALASVQDPAVERRRRTAARDRDARPRAAAAGSSRPSSTCTASAGGSSPSTSGASASVSSRDFADGWALHGPPSMEGRVSTFALPRPTASCRRTPRRGSAPPASRSGTAPTPRSR